MMQNTESGDSSGKSCGRVKWRKHPDVEEIGVV
jgi:hypothetical protein